MNKLTVALIVVLCVGTMTKARSVPWTPGQFRGIETGKSTKVQVRRILGTPTWIGHPEDDEDAPVMSKLAYEYEISDPAWEKIRIWMDGRTGVVEQIVLDARYPHGASIAEALSVAGLPEDGGNSKLDLDYHYVSSNGHLVYPRLGLSLNVDENKIVLEAIFSATRW